MCPVLCHKERRKRIRKDTCVWSVMSCATIKSQMEAEKETTLVENTEIEDESHLL